MLLMKEITINANEAGQRLDKLLAKYLNQAPRSFIYKMLRKKNIVLNGHKASGGEILSESDHVRVYLADETYQKFANPPGSAVLSAGMTPIRIPIIYEDDNILIMNKPVGTLSQKAKPDDVSVVEIMTSYLISSGFLKEADLTSFHPAVCNRLDRNTSGIIVGGKTLIALRTMNQIFKERTIHKYYHCIVKGEVRNPGNFRGYLRKDSARNTVTLSEKPFEDSVFIETSYKPVKSGRDGTLLDVCLITGKTHQIRACLAKIGHPIAGDAKYGDRAWNAYYKEKYGARSQLLHAYLLEFPRIEGRLSYLSGKSFTAEEPELFRRVIENL